MIGSIWSMGSEAFITNSAARAMVYIMFYAIAATLISWVTNLIGGKAKLAGYAITTLGGIACLVVFINEAVKLIEKVGKTLGL